MDQQVRAGRESEGSRRLVLEVVDRRVVASDPLLPQLRATSSAYGRVLRVLLRVRPGGRLVLGVPVGSGKFGP